MNGAIVTNRLSRRFGRRVAVDGVDLVVRRGEVFGLIGPNGAGKTTLIRMLCGIQRPSGGRAAVLGLDPARDAGRLQPLLGYMSQAFSLYRELTVGENLRFYADVYGGVPPERVAAVCRAVGLQEADLSFPTGRLSTGTRQRSALAAAVLHLPELVFLDEPTSGVDPVGRRDLWALMRGLAAGGTTVVVTTHVMAEAARCDRVALMDEGRVLATGTPAELRATPGLTITVVDARPWQTAYATLKTVWPDVTLAGTSLRIPRSGPTTEAEVLGTLDGVRIEGVRQEEPTFEDAFVWFVRRGRAARLTAGAPP